MIRSVKALALCLMFMCLGLQANAEPVRGAGSTFAFPVIAKWSQTFQAALAGADFTPGESGVDYEPIGSLAGTMRLSQPEIDFAASDIPLPPEDLKRLGLMQFPVVTGGIAIVANLPGVKAGELKLDGAALVDIFSGRIQRWNDSALHALNGGLALPDLPITVVHRSDGSGTTFNFTRYLAERSAAWKADVGSDTLVKWPVGVGREGSRGVIRHTEQTQGAVTYVEFGQVARTALAIASIQNAAGAFVKPDAASLQSATANAEWAQSADFYLFLTDAPGLASYPLAATTFIQMHREGRSGFRTRRTLLFFQHALDAGADDAAALGYVPLPAPVVRQVKEAWRTIYGSSARF